MIFELAIIFTFQTFYGYLYYQMGILVTLFMTGIAAGSLFITDRLTRISKPLSFFLRTDLGIVIFALMLPGIFFLLSGRLEKAFSDVLLYPMFLILSFLAG